LAGKLEKNRPLGDTGVDEKILLKQNLMKQYIVV
jgi:hypothetical protein